MFQVGTYEIFVEMRMYGRLAELLYCLLYFYVFEMGTTLVPALFVTLIQMRLNEKDIALYTAALMRRAVCPACQEHNNYAVNPTLIHIMVTSPKISPLLNSKQITHSPSQLARQLKRKGSEEMRQVRLFIEHSEEGEGLRHHSQLGHKFLSYSSRIKALLRQAELRASQETDSAELSGMLASI